MATVTVKNINGGLAYFIDGQPATKAAALAAVAAEPQVVAAVNEKALIDKAKASLTANATYLAIATPTNAQVSTQVKALTRQVNALIKIAARDLADANGT